MKKYGHFLSKLACALVVIFTIGSAIAPIADNSLSSWPSQTVYAKKVAKKAKKVKKKTKKSKKAKKKRTAAVASSWHWKKPKASVYIDLDNNEELIFPKLAFYFTMKSVYIKTLDSFFAKQWNLQKFPDNDYNFMC